MARSGITRAMENRGIRQDALRAQLAEQCRIQHILDSIAKIEALGESNEDEEESQARAFQLNKWKTSVELRLKLLNKYLPDLKSTELTGEGGGPLEFQQRITNILPVKPKEITGPK